jgi:hypothetical protein
MSENLGTQSVVCGYRERRNRTHGGVAALIIALRTKNTVCVKVRAPLRKLSLSLISRSQPEILFENDDLKIVEIPLKMIRKLVIVGKWGVYTRAGHQVCKFHDLKISGF